MQDNFHYNEAHKYRWLHFLKEVRFKFSKKLNQKLKHLID